MRHSLLVCLTIVLATTLGIAQKKYLQSGPMLGYVDMREALLWVQTTQAARVQFEYWPTERPSERHRTEPYQTQKSEAYTARCIADAVQPGVSYTYQLWINGKRITLPYPTTFKTQPLWQYRTDPPAFTFLVGSCNYVNDSIYDRPGKPYGDKHEIFGSMAAQKAELMLWLGDNTYLREPDWYTRTGMIHRYTHDRALPQLQPFLASTAHYAIWDDHDFGPDDSGGTWVQAKRALDLFRLFWGNPTYGVAGQESCATRFQYADVDFFMLDNRMFRTPDHCTQCPNRSQLGATQREWLLASLAASRAPFKVVALGGQFLTTNENHETFAHFNPAEHDSILARIEREGIKNVIFLTGDRHFAELSKYTNARGHDLYDLTTSPLTAGPYKTAQQEKNALRVAGTLYGDRNFAAVRVSGPRKARQLDITLYNTEGQALWT